MSKKYYYKVQDILWLVESRHIKNEGNFDAKSISKVKHECFNVYAKLKPENISEQTLNAKNAKLKAPSKLKTIYQLTTSDYPKNIPYAYIDDENGI